MHVCGASGGFQGHEFINDKLDVTVGKRHRHIHTLAHALSNKSIMLAMIALLYALGFCSGPKELLLRRGR